VASKLNQQDGNELTNVDKYKALYTNWVVIVKEMKYTIHNKAVYGLFAGNYETLSSGTDGWALGTAVAERKRA
jgi:hypothetical protein